MFLYKDSGQTKKSHTDSLIGMGEILLVIFKTCSSNYKETQRVILRMINVIILGTAACRKLNNI